MAARQASALAFISDHKPVRVTKRRITTGPRSQRYPSSARAAAGDRTRFGEQCRLRRAYTIIELLIVISIIAVLAGLVFAVLTGVDKQKTRRLVAAQMAQVDTALHRYQAQIGYYPPWTTNSTATNTLYYELVGTERLASGELRTRDGQQTIPFSALQTFFSVFDPGFSGFANSGQAGTQSPTDPDSVRISTYLPGLKSSQILEVANNVRLLGVPVKGPEGRFCLLNYRAPGIHHPESFDLWVVVTIDNKTETIGNWQRSQ